MQNFVMDLICDGSNCEFVILDIIILCLVHFCTSWLCHARCWSCWVCLARACRESSRTLLKIRTCDLFLDGFCAAWFVAKRVWQLSLCISLETFRHWKVFCSCEVMDLYLLELWYGVSNVNLSFFFFLVWIVNDAITSRKFVSGSTKIQQESVGLGCCFGRIDLDTM